MEANASQKYCKHCGQLIDKECVICPMCGKQVEDLANRQPQQIVINNQNTNTNENVNVNGVMPPPKSKMVALLLCIFLGFFGAHRLYVGKVGTGIVWLFTAGLFGIGWIADIILIAIGSFRDRWGRALM